MYVCMYVRMQDNIPFLFRAYIRLSSLYVCTRVCVCVHRAYRHQNKALYLHS